MALDIAVKITGNEKTRADRRAAKAIVNEENTKRQDAANQANAESGAQAGDENFVEPTLLPIEPNVEMFNSYETILANRLQEVHASYIDQHVDLAELKDVRNLWPNATEEQRDAAIAALNTEPPPE